MKFTQKDVMDLLTVFMIVTLLLLMEVLNDFQVSKMVRDLWNSFH